MLTHLTIRNYALIRHLEMRPSQKLTVITGETGAGKSIMLGALGLLLGNRSDTRVLWDENEKCVTEGTFEVKSYALKALFEAHDLDYLDQTIFRREISPGGKSRAFINDTPVTLDVMRTIGGRLMDIHSQHETLDLGSHAFQLSLIDSYAGHDQLLSEYQQAWKQYQAFKKDYERLVADAGKLKSEFDFIKFQLDELRKASLRDGEQEELESGLTISEHAEEIKTKLNQLLTALSGGETSAVSILGDAIGIFHPLRNYSAPYEQLMTRLESLRIELKDVVAELESQEEQIEADPKRTEELRERLDMINGLLQKHRLKSIAELIALQENLEQQAQKTVNLDEDLLSAKNRFEESKKKLERLASSVSSSRKKTFAPLTKQLTGFLQDLGIPNATLKIDAVNTEPAASGADQVDILFSANKGIAPRPLQEIASGGEFSRLMFCVKYVMAEKTALPTLVLDEIDTGVSGEIAMQLGKMMQAMAKRHQLIAISHLPQIAARGNEHLLVYKDNSSKKVSSEIRSLSEEERIEEIAKMIGGAKPSSAALENARELINA